MVQMMAMLVDPARSNPSKKAPIAMIAHSAVPKIAPRPDQGQPERYQLWSRDSLLDEKGRKQGCQRWVVYRKRGWLANGIPCIQILEIDLFLCYYSAT